MGVQIGLVVGAAKALLRHRDILPMDENLMHPNHLHPSPTQTDHMHQSPMTESPSLSPSPSILDSPSSTLTLKDPGLSRLDRIETDVRTLETFLTQKLVPDPRDSCCGGDGESGQGCGSDEGAEGGSGGDCQRGGECGKDEASSTHFFQNSFAKDQRGKAEDCLIFAHQLRHQIESFRP